MPADHRPRTPRTSAHGAQPISAQDGVGPVPEDIFDIATFAREKGEGLAPIALPESILGATITASLIWDSDMRRNRVVLPVYLSFAMSLALKICVTWGVVVAVDEMDHTCAAGYFTLLRIPCVAIFMLFVLTGLRSLVEMHRWVHRIPRSDEYESLRLGKFSEDRTKTRDDGSHVKEPFTWFAPQSGMTIRTRSFIYGVVLFPKFCLALVLLLYGSAYVLYADSNENLILNSVAMTFVMDIDTMVYTFAISGTVKSLLGSLPPIGVGPKSLHDHRSDYYFEAHGAWIANAALLVLVPLISAIWCAGGGATDAAVSGVNATIM